MVGERVVVCFFVFVTVVTRSSRGTFVVLFVEVELCTVYER